MRGITLNYKASQLVNLETIKDLVLNGRLNSTVTVRTDKKIKRKRFDGACVLILTKPEDKIYRVFFFKLRWLDDNASVPMGINRPVVWRERHFDWGDERGC